MGDLQKALDILVTECGPIANIKFLLADGMQQEDVAAELLGIAEDTRDGKVQFIESYPEPDLRVM